MTGISRVLFGVSLAGLDGTGSEQLEGIETWSECIGGFAEETILDESVVPAGWPDKGINGTAGYVSSPQLTECGVGVGGGDQGVVLQVGVDQKPHGCSPA